ncbi:MAG: hypothetical protein KKB70_05835, partial [Proteobacteria bacterium]|nr:hypothetical protein [Pseudomonadota bacterium]
MIIVIPSIDDNGQGDPYLVETPEGLDPKTAVAEAKKLVMLSAQAVVAGEYDHMMLAMDAQFQEHGWPCPYWLTLDLDWRVEEAKAQ